MPLTDASALVVAWLIVPALVVLIAAGLGVLVARLSSMRLGFITLPAGLLAAIVWANGLVYLHLPPEVVLVATLLPAAAGLALAARGAWPKWPKERARRLWRSDAGVAVVVASVAWLLGMLPLIASGRLGVLGYLFNNDAAIHLAAVETLRDHGAAGLTKPAISGEFAYGVFTRGYPTGSHVIVMLAAMATKAPAWHLWTPVLTTMLAMLSLSAFHFFRDFKAPLPVAAIGSLLAGTGYLVYSYMLQGGLKEVMFAVCLPTTIALAMLSYEHGLRPRTLLPAAIGIAAMLSVFGTGSAAWLAPGAITFAALCTLRPAAGMSRGRALSTAALAGAVGLSLAAPTIADALRFVSGSRSVFGDPNQVGNLLGPVPWYESFGIWLQHDYRASRPEWLPDLNFALIGLAGIVGAIGLAGAVLRRSWTLPLALASAAAAAAVMVARLSIYFEAKSYVVLAPPIAIAVGFGVTELIRRRGVSRVVGIAAGVLLAGFAAISCAATYFTAWHTPNSRFAELAAIGNRLAGRGPVLVSDREDYARVLLERNTVYEPWQTYNVAVRGLRDPQLVGDPARSADTDDFTDAILRKVRWIVVRDVPGGSRPPGDFSLVSTGRHYSVWHKTGPDPKEHLPVGLAGEFWAGRLDCSAKPVRDFLARAQGGAVRIAPGGTAPVEVKTAGRISLGTITGGPLPNTLERLGISAALIARPRLVPNARYDTYLMGQFNRGFTHIANGKHTGYVHDDLGLISSWQWMGSFVARGNGKDMSTMLGFEKGIWRPGALRPDLVGSTVFVKRESRPPVTVTAAQARRYCGERVDWLERL